MKDLLSLIKESALSSGKGRVFQKVLKWGREMIRKFTWTKALGGGSHPGRPQPKTLFPRLPPTAGPGARLSGWLDRRDRKKGIVDEAVRATTIRTVGHLCPPYICCLCFTTSSTQCQEEEVCANRENKVAGGGLLLSPWPPSPLPTWLPPLLTITDSHLLLVFTIIIVIISILLLIIIGFHLEPTPTLHLQQTSHLSLENPGALNPFSFTDGFPSGDTSFPLFT